MNEQSEEHHELMEWEIEPDTFHYEDEWLDFWATNAVTGMRQHFHITGEVANQTALAILNGEIIDVVVTSDG